MEWVIRHGGVQEMELYNCSAHTPEEWTRLYGDADRITGTISIAWAVLVELMYIPCMLVLSKKEFYSYSCFKIMFVLGMVDMGAVAVNSLIHGFLLYEGAVFCSYPTLIFISGSFGLAFWVTSCMLGLLLALNRSFDLFRPEIGRIIFGNNRTYFAIMLPLLYGTYFFLYTPPCVFTSKYQAWFFDPFIYPNRTYEYSNYSDFANNCSIVSLIVGLYAFLVIGLGKKLKSELVTGSATTRAHKQIFVQSSIICAFTSAAAIVYVVMNFFEVPLIIVKIGHMMWQLDHSSPAFIYLLVNKTIRKSAVSTLSFKGGRRTHSSNQISVHQEKSSRPDTK